MKKLAKAFGRGLFIVVFAIAAGTGCSEKRPEGMPELHPLTLRFTQEGAPCEGASVRLVPEETSPWPVGGSTDSSGTTQLSTYGKYPGVPPGKYKVLISKTEHEPEGPPPKTMYEKSEEKPVYHLMDPIFAFPTQTPLHIEVKGGKNAPDPMELGKKVRVAVKKPGE